VTDKGGCAGREEREVLVSAWSREDGGPRVEVDNILPSSRPAFGAVEGCHLITKETESSAVVVTELPVIIGRSGRRGYMT
jgi:hypothetical protein